MSNDDDKFGSPIGRTRWFKGDVTETAEPIVPVRKRWQCPHDGCGGEMKFNGMVWPTGDPGYHHTCTACGFTAAIHGKKYPFIEYQS